MPQFSSNFPSSSVFSLLCPHLIFFPLVAIFDKLAEPWELRAINLASDNICSGRVSERAREGLFDLSPLLGSHLLFSLSLSLAIDGRRSDIIMS